MSCGVGRSLGSDPELLWLWHRPVATAPTGPLAWEPPYGAGAAIKKKNRRKSQAWGQKRIPEEVMENDDSLAGPGREETGEGGQ